MALKFLAAHLTEDSASRERFLREARAAAALSHPNICTVYEVNEADGVLFIAMELCDGQQFNRLVRPSPLPLAEALPIAMQIADALSTAHKALICVRPSASCASAKFPAKLSKRLRCEQSIRFP